MPYTRSPWRRIPFASIASRIFGDNEPVGPLVASAKLDRSDDGQVHTISTYAFSAVRPAMRAAHKPKARPATASRADAGRVHRTQTRVRDDVRPPLHRVRWNEI